MCGGARIVGILLLALAPAAGSRAQAPLLASNPPAARPGRGTEARSKLPGPAGYRPLPDWPGSAAARAAQPSPVSGAPPSEAGSPDPIAATTLPGQRGWLGNNEGLPNGGALGRGDTDGMTLAAGSQSQSASKPQAGAGSAAQQGSPRHIFWVIPAFKVQYGGNFHPLTPGEKFHEWAQGSYDPLGLGAGAFEAGTLEYSSSDGFCGYGHGWGGYGECFGSLELDATNSSFIGDFVLPVLMHQDPRYFRLGEGGFGRRVWYAVSRVFVTYNDSGHTVFYTSALSGTFIAAGLSNFYYPAQDVGVRHTMTRAAIDLGNTALYNAAAEFWPDIKRKIYRVF